MLDAGCVEYTLYNGLKVIFSFLSLLILSFLFLLYCKQSDVLAWLFVFLARVLIAVGVAWPNHLADFAKCISVS